MARPTDIRIVSARSSTLRIAYRAPMKFGGRVVTDAVLLDVEVEVETRQGRRGRGIGSMPIGSVWAWPVGEATAEARLEAMIALGEAAVARANDFPDFGHALELTHELSEANDSLAARIMAEQGISDPMPRLAQLVAISPLQAAIHDAQGKAQSASAYDLLGSEHVSRDLAAYLGPKFSGEYLDQYTLRQPKPRMPLYHLVGALDPLSAADLAPRGASMPVGDGLPETLDEWIAYDGLTHLKIKLAGDDLAWDVERVIAVERVAIAAQAQRGCRQWHYSLDFNEKCASVDYLLDFFAQLRAQAPAAWDRVQYIEQPTHRDLAAHPENRMHRAAELKPVVIDESLTDLASLELCRELGYSGVALKACKGHTDALLMGAAAQKYGMFLCVQDLTCPGASFLHSASLAARIPTIAAIEGNARQYCPAGNRGWSDRYPGMFRITDGTVETGLLNGPGLGF